MAKYQKYAEYKDSGIERLGEIPNHWNVGNLKFSFVGIKNGATETQIEESNNTVPISRIESISTGEINYEKVGFVNKYSIAESYKINEGDILLSHINSLSMVGNIALKRDTSILYHGMNLLRLMPNKDKFDPKYLFWILKSKYFRNSVESIAKPAINQASVSIDSLKNISLLIPTKIEQQDIANFLDHETAKIDTLIAKQEKLIEVLKEKRQAVISHAVTKGLNPDVAMKDSGVEWLGQVPEHWTVSKFGYISQVVRGGSPRPAGDPTLFNGDYSPWVTVAEITKDDELYLTSTETFLTKRGSEQCRVFQSGTLLLSNSGATLGVPKILTINANANDGVVGFENLKIDTEYAYFYLSVLTNDLRERVKQGSGQPNLNTDIVKAISITIPPENEVKEIVADIKKKIDHFSKLMASAESAIQLMQERRTALISSVVTGKINVSNWQHPNEAKTEFSA